MNNARQSDRPYTIFKAIPRGKGSNPLSSQSPETQVGSDDDNDSQTGILSGIPESAICVQRFDDSRNLQFTLLIAFRCVLHRCESQEIRCQKLFQIINLSDQNSNNVFLERSETCPGTCQRHTKRFTQGFSPGFHPSLFS